MEFTYKVAGSDGQAYGPVSLEGIKEWIQQGRLNGESRVLRSDQADWQSASTYPELNLETSSPPPLPAVATHAPAAPSMSMGDPVLEGQVKSGASWFYWIAGLSIVNTISAMSGSDWGFILGLGITQVIDVFGRQFDSTGMVIAIALDAVVFGLFITFGIFANKKHLWAFIVGMLLYALDGVIYVLGEGWLSVGFHVFALFYIFKGFQAARELRA